MVVRFSNGNGQLDPDGRLQVRGMAVKFYAGGTREPDFNRADLPLGLTMGMILSSPMVLAGIWAMATAKPVSQPQPA